MSMRMLDESDDIERMLHLIYDLYEEAGMEYIAPSSAASSQTGGSHQP
jgi:hypothetical protein